MSFAFLEKLSLMAPSGCPHLILQAVAGPMAAATASTITNPMDVVRARVQVRKAGAFWRRLSLFTLQTLIWWSPSCWNEAAHKHELSEAFRKKIVAVYVPGRVTDEFVIRYPTVGCSKQLVRCQWLPGQSSPLEQTGRSLERLPKNPSTIGSTMNSATRQKVLQDIWDWLAQWQIN